MTDRPNPALGVILVVRGKAEALSHFGNTVASFLSSLAPLLAFPIAGALIELFRDGPLEALTTLAVSIIMQLTPPVVSHALAKRWEREDVWLRYSTAYNWCFWILPMLTAILTVLFGIAVEMGFPSRMAVQGILMGVGVYSLWLHWFLARNGLQLTRWRAFWMVVAVNAATLLLAVAPAQLG